MMETRQDTRQGSTSPMKIDHLALQGDGGQSIFPGQTIRVRTSTKSHDEHRCLGDNHSSHSQCPPTLTNLCVFLKKCEIHHWLAQAHPSRALG